MLLSSAHRRTESAPAVNPTAGPPGPVRLLAADSRPLWIEAVKATVRESRSIEFIGEATEWPQAIRAISERSPDVALIDDRLAGSPIETLAAARKIEAAPRVLFIAESPETAAVYEAMANGATGYFTRDVAPQALVKAVRDASEGRAALSPQLQTRLATEIRERATGERVALSEREREILQLVADGERTAAIARRLGVSPATVKHSLGQIYAKLQVRDRAAAVAIAMRRGLVA